MKFVIDCYECKWQTTRPAHQMESWLRQHAEEEPTHSVSVRLVPDAPATDEDRIVALNHRLNEHVARMNGYDFELEKIKRGYELLIEGLSAARK
jgi:hypothetical protein